MHAFLTLALGVNFVACNDLLLQVAAADNAATRATGVDDEWFAVAKEQTLAAKCAV